MQSFKVEEKNSNQTILQVIMKKYPHLDFQTLNKAFRKKDIKLNDVRVSKDSIASKGDVVEVYIIDEILNGVHKIDTVYQDENVLIVYKTRRYRMCKQ